MTTVRTGHKPPRIQGKRWVIFEFDRNGNIVAIPGLVRFETWARFQARDLSNAVVIPVPAAEANRIARSAAAVAGKLQVDETRLAELAGVAEVSPKFMR